MPGRPIIRRGQVGKYTLTIHEGMPETAYLSTGNQLESITYRFADRERLLLFIEMSFGEIQWQ